MKYKRLLRGLEDQGICVAIECLGEDEWRLDVDGCEAWICDTENLKRLQQLIQAVLDEPKESWGW